MARTGSGESRTAERAMSVPSSALWKPNIYYNLWKLWTASAAYKRFLKLTKVFGSSNGFLRLSFDPRKNINNVFCQFLSAVLWWKICFDTQGVHYLKGGLSNDVCMYTHQFLLESPFKLFSQKYILFRFKSSERYMTGLPAKMKLNWNGMRP